MFMGLIFDNLLLQMEECFLVVDMLANLHHALPLVRCILLFAVWTLRVLLVELYYGGLEQLRRVIDVLRHCYLDFDAARMRLRPNKISRDQFEFAQSFDLGQANSEELLGLSFAVNPRRSFPSLAIPAEN